ncbi:hypothetical protein SteCoe_1039 [Stentor coeruleus]|uniref:C2H2-type domain-containing protein n=1 Tax=Stentor coeruleus TaxID=5963 RepID=A0A1R2D315_9CILI|nr:hypothetical protein SteCoe_1039 [Stentor coeruleus]
MENTNNTTEEFLKCSYANCGKLLSSKYNLKRHIESCHLGSRPYECHICYKRFSSKQNKREHVRLEHSYSCDPNDVTSNVSEVKGTTMEIPKLSTLLYNSADPDIRPFTKIQRVYLYADLFDKVDLPILSEDRQAECKLPYHS